MSVSVLQVANPGSKEEKEITLGLQIGPRPPIVSSFSTTIDYIAPHNPLPPYETRSEYSTIPKASMPLDDSLSSFSHKKDGVYFYIA